MSGKTVLSQLLYNYALRRQHDLHLLPVHFTWHKVKSPPVPPYCEFLNQQTRGVVPAHSQELLTRSDLLLIVDQVQLTYEHEDFWLQLIKGQAQFGQSIGLYVILFSSFGSADSIALQIEGSAPITLDPLQRISLKAQPGRPDDIALCFTRSEFNHVCELHNTNFRLHADVRDRIYALTNGHPGLCFGILFSLKDLIVCIYRLLKTHVLSLVDQTSSLFRRRAFKTVSLRCMTLMTYEIMKTLFSHVFKPGLAGR